MITPFAFWDIHTSDMWKVCLQTFRNNRIYQKLAYFLRNLQTLRADNSRILRSTNAKLSGNCFYMNTDILGDFQICISVPLKKSHAEQTFLLLCLKRDHSQTLKVATAKDIFSSVYVIATICFDKGFLFHVKTGRHRFPWGLFKRHAHALWSKWLERSPEAAVGRSSSK